VVGEVKGVEQVGVGFACRGARSTGDRRSEIEVNPKRRHAAHARFYSGQSRAAQDLFLLSQATLNVVVPFSARPLRMPSAPATTCQRLTGASLVVPWLHGCDLGVY